MMGPFLIYASLMNGAAMALYNGSPLGRGFAKFVQDAKVTLQGTVPRMVKAWKTTNALEGLDWTNLRDFATTGEASSLDDDLWLASRANYKAPVIEVCGGTELASGYVCGCLQMPQAFAAFSTPAMLTEFVILDDYGNAYPEDQPCIGEVGLVAVNFGTSDRLLNADHEKVYYTGMPLYKGKRLRRHGDLMERRPRGFYRAHGRSDDTMNLGGIKASAVEIERVCNTAHESILETAALALSPVGGGPERLVIMVVFKDGPVLSTEEYSKAFQLAIQKKLNPLFKVSAVGVSKEFPRTASNKLLRRVLRAQIAKEQKQKAMSKL
jgi:acyl-coenzyme A synthetase/AMP-(fatty) acid ligase